ncbi:MAG: FAD-dependent oxidoreductase [Firmicutes bacterium]|nr:FAD-dependent oxidoreductase [Bacillota bacterium]
MSDFNRYPHVFQSLNIGKVTVKNRIMSPPMLSALATPDGQVTHEVIAFAGAMARTGAGLVTIGDSCVDNGQSIEHVAAIRLGEDTIIPGLTHVVEEIHRYGAKASIELNHGGALAFKPLLKGKPCLGPSHLPDYIHPVYKEYDVKPMDKADMKQVIDNYVSAVGRCVKARFDVVMIHSAHGWLFGQFLSPSFNQRTDEYGGSLENRIRFPLEILRAIRDEHGNKIAIDLRVSGSPRVPETFNEMEIDDLLVYLEKAQEYVDIANFSAGFIPYLPSLEYMIQPYFLPHKVNAIFAEKAKAVLKIPVTALGSIMTMAEAEALIANSQADMVGMGRAGLSDSYAFVKAYRGQDDRIRPCIRCVYCGGRAEPPFFRAIRCAVNPRVGRELEYSYVPKANQKKKVMIIGGGPAGMQAAQTAIEQGHEVVLYEKTKCMGGMLHTASALPFKVDMRRYNEWMIQETAACGAKIVYNTEVTPDLIKKETPDVVMIAIGSVPAVPPIPGITGKNVVWGGDVDAGREKTGNKVVVAGAGLTGAECAIGLAQDGKEVTLIDMIPAEEFTKDAAALVRLSIHSLCEKLNIKIIFEATIIEITENSVKYVDKKNNQHELPVDTVVNALGMSIERDKVQALMAVVPETYLIGDCNEGPKNIINAIESAFTFALEI